MAARHPPPGRHAKAQALRATRAPGRLLPLSASVLIAAYQLTMVAEVEQAFGRELARLTRRRRPER